MNGGLARLGLEQQIGERLRHLPIVALFGALEMDGIARAVGEPPHRCEAFALRAARVATEDLKE